MSFFSTNSQQCIDSNQQVQLGELNAWHRNSRSWTAHGLSGHKVHKHDVRELSQVYPWACFGVSKRSCNSQGVGNIAVIMWVTFWLNRPCKGHLGKGVLTYMEQPTNGNSCFSSPTWSARNMP